jgi:hypothetical protein
MVQDFACSNQVVDVSWVQTLAYVEVNIFRKFDKGGHGFGGSDMFSATKVAIALLRSKLETARIRLWAPNYCNLTRLARAPILLSSPWSSFGRSSFISRELWTESKIDLVFIFEATQTLKQRREHRSGVQHKSSLLSSLNHTLLHLTKAPGPACSSE